MYVVLTYHAVQTEWGIRDVEGGWGVGMVCYDGGGVIGLWVFFA